ncbi:hypothetical protein XBFM1_1510008 [Xenorhabdus bovienii str. feltiae Moldova]|uniref:Uncharacterized protein n=1 Tax=Xenorhabdus bovienii str. feltiae Moldova TaxID=1398200 RepID=A0A077NNB8_XENBV|nr:hypothetical protein XBFM1_1510008 [Xenorhabdus bovienii str. feltiae Moldova]
MRKAFAKINTYLYSFLYVNFIVIKQLITISLELKIYPTY